MTVGSGYLPGHLATGGGTGASPWAEQYGDYCNYYRLSPLNSAVTASLGRLTGYTPPAPHGSYQLGGATGSACAGSGDAWAEGLSGREPGADCSDVADVCGMQHSVSFGDARYYLPWYAPDAYLILTARYEPAVLRYSSPNSDAWGYLCALLEDTATNQRLEYCLNEWSTWGAAPDGVTAFFDPFLGEGFANVQTNFAPGTLFATEEPESHDTIAGPGALGTAHAYGAAITRDDLARAIDAVNARIEDADGDVCPRRQPTCFSKTPGAYQLVGLENGQEMWGDVNYLGGSESELWAATVAPGSDLASRISAGAAERLTASARATTKLCRKLRITPLTKHDARRLTGVAIALAASNSPRAVLGPGVVTGPTDSVDALARDPLALSSCLRASSFA